MPNALSQIVANGETQVEALSTDTHPPRLCLRYVDDTFQDKYTFELEQHIYVYHPRNKKMEAYRSWMLWSTWIMTEK